MLSDFCNGLSKLVHHFEIVFILESKVELDAALTLWHDWDVHLFSRYHVRILKLLLKLNLQLCLKWIKRRQCSWCQNNWSWLEFLNLFEPHSRTEAPETQHSFKSSLWVTHTILALTDLRLRLAFFLVVNEHIGVVCIRLLYILSKEAWLCGWSFWLFIEVRCSIFPHVHNFF